MRPSQIKEMIVKYTWCIPFGSFFIMTFWGKMLIKRRDKDDWEKVKNTSYGAKYTNHEMIHVKQAVSTNDSWFKFYLLYIWYYLKTLPIINGFKMPYYFIPFEIEAYRYEDDLSYIEKNNNGTTDWKRYKKLTLKQKKQLYKDYQNSILPFSKFIKANIEQFL